MKTLAVRSGKHGLKKQAPVLQQPHVEILATQVCSASCYPDDVIAAYLYQLWLVIPQYPSQLNGSFGDRLGDRRANSEGRLGQYAAPA